MENSSRKLRIIFNILVRHRSDTEFPTGTPFYIARKCHNMFVDCLLAVDFEKSHINRLIFKKM